MRKSLIIAGLMLGAAAPASAEDFSGWLSKEIDRNMRAVAPMRGPEPEGIVRVAFRLDESGRPTAVRIARSSGVRALDREALRTVAALRPAPADHPRGAIEAVLQYGTSVSPARDAELARALAREVGPRGSVQLAGRGAVRGAR